MTTDELVSGLGKAETRFIAVNVNHVCPLENSRVAKKSGSLSDRQMSVVYASINSLLQHAKEADAQAQKRKNEDVDESGSKKRRLGELTSTTEIIDCAPVQSRDRVQQKQGQANRKSYKDRKNPNRTRSNVIFEHGNYLDYYG